MTRTSVRRHVDVNDGRVVIRKIVVETEIRDTVPTEIVATPAVEQRRHRGLHRLRAPRFRDARQSIESMQS